MPQPARQNYDPDSESPVIRPDLSVLEGGGETTPPRQDHLIEVQNSGVIKPESLDQAERSSGDGQPDKPGGGTDNVSARHGGSGGSLYKSQADLAEMKPTPRGIVRFAKNNKGKMIVGGGISAGFVALLIAGFLFVLPMKVMHIMNNLHHKFFATAEQAMEKETDRLFSNYIKKKIRLGGCTGVRVDSSCNPFTAGDSLVTRLYRGWNNGKLEDKLWKDYGIAFARDKSGFQLQFRDTQGGTSLNGLVNGNKTLDDLLKDESKFSPAKRTELRQKLKTAFEHETRTKKVMYYIKVKRLLKAKYGIKFCTIGCPQFVNKYRDWKDNKRRAMKMFMAERVLVGRAEMYSYLYTCILTEACTPDTFTKPIPTEYVSDTSGVKKGIDVNGEALSTYDKDIRSTILISRLLSAYGGDVDKLTKDYEAFKNKGLRGLITSRLDDTIKADGEKIGENGNKGNAGLGKKGAALLAKKAVNAVPIVGWINMGAVIINSQATIRKAMPKIVYVMNATAAAQMFAMYRTHVDEIKEGNVDAAVVGSYTEALGPGVQVDSDEKDQIGGLAQAEGTPLYGALFGSNKPDTIFAQTSQGLFGTVKAAAPESKCSDGKPIPAGKLICDEEKIRQDGNQLTKNWSKVSDNPYWGTIEGAAEVWQKTKSGIVGGLCGAVGAVKNVVCKVLNLLGLCDALESAVSKVANIIEPYTIGPLKDLLDKALKGTFVNIFGYNLDMISNRQSGGRTFDVFAAGADVSGNEFCHNGIGCGTITQKAALEIQDEQAQWRKIAYESKPLLSRVFDKESEHSPLVRMAMAMPSDKNQAIHGVLAKVKNPLDLIMRTFGSLFSSPFAKAATETQIIDDPFGITQYGYSDDDPIFDQDPDEYWNKYCTSILEDGSPNPDFKTQKWNQAGADAANEESAYQPVNKVTNGCLLIQSAVGSAGAIFTDEVLSPEELSDSQNTPLESPATPAGARVEGDIGLNSDTIACAQGTNDLGTVTTKYTGDYKKESGDLVIRLCQIPSIPGEGNNPNGTEIGGGAVVNSRVSGAWQALGTAAKKAGVALYSNSSFRLDDSCGGNGDGGSCATPGGSPHQLGVAIDFGNMFGINPDAQTCERGVRLRDLNSPSWKWMYANAEFYGFEQYSAESWHWDPLPSANRCNSSEPSDYLAARKQERYLAKLTELMKVLSW